MRAKWMLGAALLAALAGAAGCSDSDNGGAADDGPAAGQTVAAPVASEAATATNGLNVKTPTAWSPQQKELAGNAIVLLFDQCPAIKTYLPDIESAKVESIDLNDPINKAVIATAMPYTWNPILLVSLSTAEEPKSKLLIAARNARGNFFAANGGGISFYLGANDKPGIFMETSLFPESLCGAAHPIPVRTQDRSSVSGSAPDTFISVPQLNLLDRF